MDGVNRMFAYLPYIRTRLAALIGDRKGVTSLEYAVIAAVTVVTVGGLMGAVGTALTAEFTAITNAL